MFLFPVYKVPRCELVQQQINLPVPVVYRNLEHFNKKILSLVTKRWSKTEDEDSVVFYHFHTPYTLPTLWLYTTVFYQMTIPSTTSILEGAQICEGLSIYEHVNAICEDPTPARGSSSVMRHTIPVMLCCDSTC